MFQFSIPVIVFITVLATGNLAEEDSDNECACIVNPVFRPVCGENGLTYNSLGELECYNKCHKKYIKLVSNSPCPCNCPVEKSFSPVCGSDGRSYNNPEAVRCHNSCYHPGVTIERKGKCHPKDTLNSS